jgi:hypothetical protein
VLHAEALRTPRWARAATRTYRVAITADSAVFAASLTLYLVVASVLVFHVHALFGDALARVANASYVVSSRTPHLGAIGFVWPPLPTLVLVPFIPLRALFPALVRWGFAGNIVSAACMAGAVVVVRKLLVDLDARPVGLLTALFALHPLIVLYGANGMTEAMLILLLALAARGVLTWCRTNQPLALTGAGLALAGATLTRYESVASCIAVTAFVFVIGRRRFRDEQPRPDVGPREATAAGLTDAVLVALPSVVAITTWVLASWVITGSPLQEFTSRYGNSSFVALGAGSQVARGWPYLARQLLVLEPFLPLALIAAGIAAWRRRDSAAAGLAAAIGPALAFQVVAFLAGDTYGFLRYYVIVVPLTVVLAGIIASRTSALSTRWRQAVAAMVALAAIGPGVGSAAIALTDPVVAPQEARVVRALRPGLAISERQSQDLFGLEERVGHAIDGLNLRDGSVLMDVAFGFPIVLQSEHPKQFVIPSDRDFAATLADPSRSHVRYILVPDPQGLGAVDAVNDEYPSLYADGAGIGRLAREFRAPRQRPWRLYELDRTKSSTRTGPIAPPVPRRG